MVFAGIILLKYSYFGKHPRAAGTLLLGGICIGTAVNIYFCFTSAGNSVSGVWQFTDAGEAYEQTDGILIDEIKEIADYVTDTNDCDGVAKAIEKFALE